MTGRSVCRPTFFYLFVFYLSVFSASVAMPGGMSGQGASADLPAVAAPAFAEMVYAAPAAKTTSILRPELSTRYPVPPDTLALQRLAHSAGIIFAGRVISVAGDASSSGQSVRSATTIFRVEHAFRGSSPGQSLRVQEWAGLRNSLEHYRVGQHVLLFLYSPGRLGLTSPVAGAMGRFAIDAEDMIVINPQHRQAFSTDPILGGKAAVSYADFARALQHLRAQK